MTETTTQPDPQVVAWMRRWRGEHQDASEADVLAAWLNAHPGKPRDWGVVLASRDAARKPLMPADIPAGQGAASLFLRAESDAVWFKRADGRVAQSENYLHIGEPGGLGAALRDHLAATLPAIDATEESK